MTLVEVKDVELSETMRRAMARQAEAERERRAKIIAADGEFQASERLSQAAAAMDATPGAMHLRTLQTMAEIAVEHNSTIIFPIPTEVMNLFHQPSPIAVPTAPRPAAPPVAAEPSAVASSDDPKL